jgi:3-hydroxybutyryl-CoA dehydratase
MTAAPQTLPEITHAVTQTQVDAYAEASGDHNPLHTDAEFAASTPYGRTVAHGMLVLSFLSEMMTHTFGINWASGGKLKVRFRAPVFPGNTVTASGTLRGETRDGEAVYDVACRVQDGQEVITGEARVWLPSG